jgi:hypothetical protein
VHCSIGRVKRKPAPVLIKKYGNRRLCVDPKTVDYLKILVGLQGAAIDGRLRKFLGMAGIAASPNDYDTPKDIVNRAADLLSVERSLLEHRHLAVRG